MGRTLGHEGVHLLTRLPGTGGQNTQPSSTWQISHGWFSGLVKEGEKVVIWPMNRKGEGPNATQKRNLAGVQEWGMMPSEVTNV